MNYKNTEKAKNQKLIEDKFFEVPAKEGKNKYILENGENNIYSNIRKDVLTYFETNNISWWGGKNPTGNTLSSQISCLNHLFPIRKQEDTILKMLNGIEGIGTEFNSLEYLDDQETTKGYISFEVIGNTALLNEGKCHKRGANCTSIDALIRAKDKNKRTYLIIIEWKYTEKYGNDDKSTEDRENEAKGSNGRGKTRMYRYIDLIKQSHQLNFKPQVYQGSIYFREPYYELMRQTLWAEKNKTTEIYRADDFIHLNVIPKNNIQLLQKKDKSTQQNLEASWKSCLHDPEKYIIIDPGVLFQSIKEEIEPELAAYLQKRYWE